MASPLDPPPWLLSMVVHGLPPAYTSGRHPTPAQPPHQGAASAGWQGPGPQDSGPQEGLGKVDQKLGGTEESEEEEDEEPSVQAIPVFGAEGEEVDSEPPHSALHPTSCASHLPAPPHAVPQPASQPPHQETAGSCGPMWEPQAPGMPGSSAGPMGNPAAGALKGSSD